MEVTLNQKDLDALAGKVADILKDRLMVAAMSDAGYERMVERGKAYADLQINAGHFEHKAKAVMLDHLKKGGELERVFANVLREVIGDEEAMRKYCREQLYKCATKAVERFAEQLRAAEEHDR